MTQMVQDLTNQGAIHQDCQTIEIPLEALDELQKVCLDATNDFEKVQS